MIHPTKGSFCRNFIKYCKILTRCRSDTHTSGQKRMRAWQIHSYGGLEALSSTESARAPMLKKPLDVLVEISASSVNPIDVAMMGGYGAKIFNIGRKLKTGSPDLIEFPLTLGRDFTGEIVEKGVGVTENFKIGDKVWGVLSPFECGCHAQYALAPESQISIKPSNLNDIEAASVLYAAVTAWSALKISGGLCWQSASSKRVLVIGGSGGVGSYGIQMLKAWGAQVVSTCNADAVPLVESMGADCVINYADASASKYVSQEGKYDIILNAAGLANLPYVDELKSQGSSMYITVTSPLLRNMDRHGLVLGLGKSLLDLASSNMSLRRPSFLSCGPSVRWAFFAPSSEAIQEITKLTSSGRITPSVDKTFKFSELPAAYQKVLNGHSRGKTVVDMRSE